MKGELKTARRQTDVAIADLYRTIIAMMDLMPSDALTALYTQLKGFERYAREYYRRHERKRPKYARISGIGNETGRFYLGFQENFESCDQYDLGFQESGQEAGAAGTDCRNLHFHRPCCSPFFWNPAPLMQNYMIKSVKMTKKLHFERDADLFVAQLSVNELRPRTRI